MAQPAPFHEPTGKFRARNFGQGNAPVLACVPQTETQPSAPASLASLPLCRGGSPTGQPSTRKKLTEPDRPSHRRPSAAPLALTPAAPPGHRLNSLARAGRPSSGIGGRPPLPLPALSVTPRCRRRRGRRRHVRAIARRNACGMYEGRCQLWVDYVFRLARFLARALTQGLQRVKLER